MAKEPGVRAFMLASMRVQLEVEAEEYEWLQRRILQGGK